MNLDQLRLERRVDQLLAPHDGTGPGATIGVVLDGDLAVHRSAGLASIEHGVKIGPATRFRIASVSKQFTCAAVLKLVGDCRLSLTDDIRQHLPELPDLGAISVDMILRNMSGLRDMLEIMRQGGMDLGVPCTTEDLLAGICRQRATNFPPGERFLYSNTNFLLAGLIVERVSGIALPAYLEQHFFRPLGMNATRMTPSTREVVADLATGYFAGPVRAAHAFPLGGEGGLVSSVVDLALWDRALSTGAADLAGLTAQANFTNGVPNQYARGLVVSHYRGVRTEDHGGLWPGFRTAFLRAPQHRATVICITNSGAIDPAALAFAALDAVLDGRSGVHAVPPMPKHDSLAGRYLDATGPMTLDLAVSDTGVVTATPYGVPMGVKPTEDGRLLAGKGAFALLIRPYADGVEVELASGHVQHFHRVAADAPLPRGLDGAYSCADMAARWTIAGDTMAVSGPLLSGQRWRLIGVEGDVLRVLMPSQLFQGWLDVRVLRDATGDVTGLYVNGGRAKGLLYSRN